MTEVRAGTYVFGDMIMATWGAVAEEEIALSILCTVVSRPTPERATVDGGSKTFAGDIAPGMMAGLTGYGRLVGADAYIEGMTEEHGWSAWGRAWRRRSASGCASSPTTSARRSTSPTS